MNICFKGIKKTTHYEWFFFINMVAAGGLEPPRLSAGDFESPLSTNSNTQPILYNSIQLLLE
ncbi:hypothetical protein VAE130_530290 [Vibrio aestuarianus]|nr:hypothetical protein VAE032_220291 [Vibrio aestuarianus]CAH8184235.1 hypothetical protein VAE055_320292 [Vibrio aestuarianus]CAH8184338.1 hypothetical protein VAE128_420292 [Vibrio aestuarianus]CAH8184380.1 hypothetical protein VAE130_530290 [Vibrio aestuarianus]CAH8184480.1 hypothetical protein VAE115_270292 [Vibrio aestuarianus]